MLLELVASVSVLTVVTVAAYVVSVALRNIRAHQFFKIHSPNLPAVPNPNWFSGHAFELIHNGRNWLRVDEWHKKLGKNIGGFYCNKAAVSTTDLNLIKRMVIDEPNDHINRTVLHLPIDEMEFDSFLSSEDDQWRRIRKAVAPAFSTHKIKSANVQAELKSVIDKLIGSIERRLDKRADANAPLELNVDDLFNRYAISLVFTCFYKQDNVVDFDADVDETVLAIEDGRRALDSFFLRLTVMFPILRPITRWVLVNLHPQGSLLAKITNFIKEQTKLNIQARQTISEAKRSGKSIDEDSLTLSSGQTFKRNMVDYIIDQFHSGRLSLREYVHSTFFLFFAANNTSADALAKIVYLLAAHQDVQDKLRAAILSEGAEAEYVSWVMLEAMRVYPPALIGCSRSITKDFYTCDGHLVPKGTFILTPAYTIHRLKEYWGEDADEFRPERWANSKDFHPCQYLAFGAGKRGCPGRDFALHEMRLLLAEMLPRYKFDKSPKSEGFLTFSSPLYIFLIPDEPTYVKISRIRS